MNKKYSIYLLSCSQEVKSIQLTMDASTHARHLTAQPTIPCIPVMGILTISGHCLTYFYGIHCFSTIYDVSSLLNTTLEVWDSKIIPDISWKQLLFEYSFSTWDKIKFLLNATTQKKAQQMYLKLCLSL
jgi:hypothetical protein